MSTAPNGGKKFRLTIGTKLVSLIAFLLLGSVVVLVWLSTNMFVEDNTALIQQMNSDAAGGLSTRMRETFQDVTDKMRMLGTVLVQDTVPVEVRTRVAQEFFAKDRDFLAVLIHRGANSPTPTLLPVAVSPELTAAGDTDGAKTLAALAAIKDFSIDAMSRGVTQLVPFHLPDGTTAIAIGVPFIAEDSTAAGGVPRFTHTLTAVIRQSKFLKAVSESDTVTSYMVDQRGRLLAHPDAARAAATEDVSQTGIVRMMLEGKTSNGQTRYPDPQNGEWRLGSFRLVGFGGLGIVSEVPEAKAFEAAQSVKRRSMYIALIILSAAFLAGYLFSNTISKRIKKLVDAAYQISQGDFAINLQPKGGDEVSTLSLAFNDMAKGLEERDRVKETFNKFHNKEIADKLLSGEVKLGGERKEATIFFSDVRGFTAMSESMEPEQVVEMLNEYMTRMVSIIRAHNGIVDKYVGDAIMAIWGVPLGGPDDALNAVKACIAMRIELAKLNELRISRGQNALKIGMGLNTGSVIAGNIGSDEKMEYTVIGDSVNLASRMESMTKEYGTDLLVPKVIQERLTQAFVFEQCKSAKVKGKSQAIEVFKVTGYIDEAGKPVPVATPYSSYESEKSDKSVHDEPAETAASPMELSPPPPSAPMLSNIAQTGPETYEDVGVLDPFVLPDEWFILVGMEARGPFTEKQISEGLETRKYSATTLVATNREGPWTELGTRTEFGAQPATGVETLAATPPVVSHELAPAPAPETPPQTLIEPVLVSAPESVGLTVPTLTAVSEPTATVALEAPNEPLAAIDLSLLLTPPPPAEEPIPASAIIAHEETGPPPREERTATIRVARPRAAMVPVAALPPETPPAAPQTAAPVPPPYRGPKIEPAPAFSVEPALSLVPPPVSMLTPPPDVLAATAQKANRRKPRPSGTRPIELPAEMRTQAPAPENLEIELPSLEITGTKIKKSA